MMLSYNSPSKPLMVAGALMSTTLVLFSNNWLMLWCYMELNLLFLTPLMMTSEEAEVLENTVKYWLIQMIGSQILVLSVILLICSINFIITKLLIMSLVMKVGAAPCHQWFPPLTNTQPWTMNFILFTTQKLPPLMMMVQLLTAWNTFIIFSLISLSALVGSGGGINQSQLKPILAYSSINNISWLIMACTVNSELMIVFFGLYTLSLGMMMVTWGGGGGDKITASSMMKTSWTYLALSLCFIMSLWGAPPFIGFMPKLLMLSYSLPSYPLLSVVLITSSMISLFYYGSVFMVSSMKSMMEKETSVINSTQLILGIPTIISIPLCISILQ